MPRLVLLPIALIACGCERSATTTTTAPSPTEPTGPEWFADVTKEVGIAFRHQAGPTGGYFMPQVMGSGVALLDIDNDGRLDILLLNNAGPKSEAHHVLYRQQPDGTFRDVSKGSGLDIAGYGMGVAVGDFDNDGFVDVYISQYGGGRLFRNKGDGRFEDVTATAGVALPHWGTSVAFVDYDRDGWLDLIIINYVDYDPSHACIEASGKADFCHPRQFPGTAARLFHNKGMVGGKWAGFEDVTASAGLAGARSNGLGVVCADFNGDGWPDIFVANDARPNHLWINQKNGTFKDEAVIRGVAYNGASNVEANMGVALADLSGSGRFDLFITHLTEERHTLWRQDLPGQFRDATADAGLAETRWRGTGFGTVAADFDHDGNIDLAVANGRVIRARLPSKDNPPADLQAFWHPYAERNQLFAGAGGGKFRDVSVDSPALTSPAGIYRGMAWGDIDNDGAIDLVVTSIEGPVKVLKNVAPKKGHWFGVRAIDPALKRDAIGAVVTVSAGGRKFVGMVNPGQSYCSSGEMRVHFGLGPAATIDEIRVSWPDGKQENFPGGAADRYVTLKRGEGKK
jgi:hypothetical protein